MANNILKSMTQSTDFNEQRKTARLDLPINVRYHVKNQESSKLAKTVNMSAGGCLLLVSEELPVDTQVELEIILGENESEILKLTGTIVRLNTSSNHTFEYGINFNHVSKEAKRLFADFCFAKMYDMIGLTEWPTDRRKK